MATVKPIGNDKKKVPFYFDDIIQIYDQAVVSRKEMFDTDKAKAALIKAKENKKSRKFSLMARAECLEMKKKGIFGRSPKVPKIPYQTIKGFYQFTDNPGFIVLLAEGRGVERQYIILANTNVEKTRKLVDVLQKAQWAPGNDLNNPVSEPKTTENIVLNAQSSSTASGDETSTDDESSEKIPAERKRISSSDATVKSNINSKNPVTTVKKIVKSNTSSSSSSSPESELKLKSALRTVSKKEPEIIHQNPISSNSSMSSSFSSSSSSSSSSDSSSSSSSSSYPSAESISFEVKEIEGTKLKEIEKYPTETSFIVYNGKNRCESKPTRTFYPISSSSSPSPSSTCLCDYERVDVISCQDIHSSGGLFVISNDEKFKQDLRKDRHKSNGSLQSRQSKLYYVADKCASDESWWSSNSSECP